MTTKLSPNLRVPSAKRCAPPVPWLRGLLRSLVGRILPAVCAMGAILTGALALTYAGGDWLSAFERVLIVSVGAGSLAAGLAAVFVLLRLPRLERERDQLARGLAVAALERDAALEQKLALENRVESLSLMREIHRTSNIRSKDERLRRILTAVAEIADAPDITLFSLSRGSADPVPSAYFRKDRDHELFMRIERPSPRGVDFYCRDKEVSALVSANRYELRGDLFALGMKCGTVEVSLNLTDENRALAERDRASLLREILAGAEISDARVGGVIEQRKPVRTELPGLGLCELIYPLLAESELVGAMSVRVYTDRIHRRRGASGVLASGGGLSGHELEEALVESSRHIAMTLKREAAIERSFTDGPTELFTKEKFIADLREAFQAAGGQGAQPLSLLMLDIDHFKLVNDTHGHLTGDQILKGVASVLLRRIRSCDVAYRYGGEELAVLLPGADIAAAVATAERIRKTVHGTRFLSEKGTTVPVTLSAGVAQYEPNLKSERELIERADQALYASKQNGRNRVTRWPLPASRAVRQTGAAKPRKTKPARGKRTQTAVARSKTRKVTKKLPSRPAAARRRKAS